MNIIRIVSLNKKKVNLLPYKICSYYFNYKI